MDNELFPPTEPDKGDKQAGSDETTEYECPADTDKNLPATQIIKFGNSETDVLANVAWYALLLIVIETIGLILWQFADGFHGFACVCIHWLSLVCLSSGPLPLAYKAVKSGKRQWVWIPYAIVWIVMAVVSFAIWMPAQEVATKEQPSAPQPDYIEGTRFTHNQLKTVFPFGYIVFRKNDAKWTYEPQPDRHIKIVADWSKVVITPDFTTENVTINIPDWGLENNPRITGAHNNISLTRKMQIGQFFTDGFFSMDNEPQLLIGMLSDDQLHPVFVFGFRIMPITHAPTPIPHLPRTNQ